MCLKKLKKEEHYNVDEKVRSVTLTDEGVDHVEKLMGVTNLWEDYSKEFKTSKVHSGDLVLK